MSVYPFVRSFFFPYIQSVHPAHFTFRTYAHVSVHLSIRFKWIAVSFYTAYPADKRIRNKKKVKQNEPNRTEQDRTEQNRIISKKLSKTKQFNLSDIKYDITQ